MYQCNAELCGDCWLSGTPECECHNGVNKWIQLRIKDQNMRDTMMRYKVTVPYRELPSYTVTGIEADTEQEALAIALDQAMLENGPHGYKQCTVEIEPTE